MSTVNKPLNIYNFYKDHIQNDKHYQNLYQKLCIIAQKNGHLFPEHNLREMFYEQLSKDFKKNPKEYEVVRNGQKRIAQLMQEFLLKQARDLSEKLKAKNGAKGVFITGMLFESSSKTIYTVDYHGIPLRFEEYSTHGSLVEPPDYELELQFPPSDHLFAQLEDEIIESFPNENIYDLPRSEDFNRHIEEMHEKEKKMSADELIEYQTSYPWGISYMPENQDQLENAFLQATNYQKEQDAKRGMEI